LQLEGVCLPRRHQRPRHEHQAGRPCGASDPFIPCLSGFQSRSQARYEIARLRRPSALRRHATVVTIHVRSTHNVAARVSALRNPHAVGLSSASSAFPTSPEARANAGGRSAGTAHAAVDWHEPYK
jgi:hypothetical protein